MEIVVAGETLEEWFRAAVHTCRRCRTVFRAGPKARAGRDYELREDVLRRGTVRVACPHCGVALHLDAPAPAGEPAPVPFLPPLPAWPWHPAPWYQPVWYGVGGFTVASSGTLASSSVPAAVGSATTFPLGDGSSSATVTVNALAVGAGAFEILG